MKTNSRERQIRKSRKLVTDEQLLLILRALRTPGRPPSVVEEINKDLDDGNSLDQIFYTGENDGYPRISLLHQCASDCLSVAMNVLILLSAST